MNNKFYIIRDWFNARTERDRLFLLIGGLIFIYLIWSVLFGRPLSVYKIRLDQEILSLTSQIKALNENTAAVIRAGTSSVIQISAPKNPTTKIIVSDTQSVVKSILGESRNIPHFAMKNSAISEGKKVLSADGLQLTFQSGYLAALAYIDQLEKLPWCLSWDSLEYKVIHYPEATVVINLRIV